MNQGASPTGEFAGNSLLQKLGKQYKLARYRYWLLLLIPVLWTMAIITGVSLEIEFQSSVLMILWFVISLFGIGAWVFLIIPDAIDLERKYVPLVLPALFQREGLGISYFPRHDLSINTLLKSGLYHDRYSGILREDSITGKIHSMPFGMYQVAVQVAGRSGEITSPGRSMTNQYYGWVIQCGISPVPGVHVILPRQRKTSDESDDWLEKVWKNWNENPECSAYLTGNPAFDSVFVVYTNRPEIFHSKFTPQFMEFLVHMHEGSHNAFGINVSGNLFVMHMGHITPSFRHCPDGDFTSEFHPELLEDVKWFSHLLKGIQRFGVST